MLRGRKGDFQRKKEGGMLALTLSLWFSQLTKKVGKEKGGCWFYQEAQKLGASGGFKSTDAGEDCS